MSTKIKLKQKSWEIDGLLDYMYFTANHANTAQIRKWLTVTWILQYSYGYYLESFLWNTCSLKCTFIYCLSTTLKVLMQAQTTNYAYFMYFCKIHENTCKKYGFWYATLGHFYQTEQMPEEILAVLICTFLDRPPRHFPWYWWPNSYILNTNKEKVLTCKYLWFSVVSVLVLWMVKSK